MALSFAQQAFLAVMGPVLTVALGYVAVNVIAARLTRRSQDLQLRMNLVSRVSEIVYGIHTELSFYERWLRHEQPPDDEQQRRRARVDDIFLAQRAKLGALQTEVDAYFGVADGPKAQLHHLTDLTMLRYALILDLPRTQIEEMFDHLGQPGHSGFKASELGAFLQIPRPVGSSQIWQPLATVESKFTVALRDTVASLVATRPDTKNGGFKSAKMLTAYDQ
jgi:hypothetical protein